MNFSEIFIRRPVATTLLTLGIALSGMIAYTLLPVASLPQVDFPAIQVQASLPGASPETMASAVATPLERALGRIASVNEMTSSSSLGSTRIVLQFDLNRDINGAARDVQAAINAARSLLPTGLPNNPTYRKANPADAPILILGLTSQSMSQGQLYDAASTILAQKLAQVDGIGQVSVGGSSLPAVRVEVNPDALNKYGIGLENVRTAIAATNANRPKGSVENDERHWQIYANDQANRAKDYLPLIVAYKNGAAVHLSDVAELSDSVQDVRNMGVANGKPSVLVILFRQPGANIIETVDRVTALLPQLRASIPHAIDLNVMMDRTPTIRASLRDVERTLITSVILVILVVFLFLRNARATLIPSVAVPVSLIGTFGVMYLCNYSLDNISLMALTIATGFVVDDAIVVLENISRHIEEGNPPMQSAILGVREVGFTVISMSISLIAVFIPILMMGGIVGRLFHEFAVTLSVAILVSLILSLTVTPMMCAYILKHKTEIKHAPSRAKNIALGIAATINGYYKIMADWLFRHTLLILLITLSSFAAILLFMLFIPDHIAYALPFKLICALALVLFCVELLRNYEKNLLWALTHSRIMILLLLAAVGLNVYLYITVPKGFFPQQDVGRLMGSIQADQSISFQAMKGKLTDFIAIVQKDPAVENVVGFTGGGQRNSGQMFISLKPLAVRKISADGVIARLRDQLSSEAGAKLLLQAQQDIRIGGRASQAQYQYTLQADNLDELRTWAPKVFEAMKQLPQLADVNTDQQNNGLQTSLVYDRDTMTRLGVTPAQVDAVLNDAFGQRQISTIYNPLNQYHVVMEVAPEYAQNTDALKRMYVITSSGEQIPLSAFSHYEPTNTALAVNHQGQFAATTISFNLPQGTSLGDASQAIAETFVKLEVPSSVQGGFQGAAKAFQESFSSMGWLLFAAVITIYIVLGILYESTIHPLTILSTLFPAGVGALLALKLFNTDFTLVAGIGVLLLIGIVKKNAIMMIDFAIVAEREHGKNPREAIYEACLLRFRPIMMTTMAAILGALPLAIGAGDGAELRQPLGISIVGGLIVSQMLTLYTTPIVYLYLDRFRLWTLRRRGQPLQLQEA